MVALTCPLCGASVKVPHSAPNTRLSCKKCHTPFYVNKDGVSVVGEPPDVEAELAELKEKLRQKAKAVPVGRIVAGLTALVVVCVAGYALWGPPGRLDRAAERAARALADNDLSTLQSMAAPDTAEDVARWLDEVRPRLVQARKVWGDKEEVAEALVAKEDPAGRTGVVGISIHPAKGTARDVSLANPAEATASASAPVDVETVWTLSRWNRWKLDGRATYAKIRPNP